MDSEKETNESGYFDTDDITDGEWDIIFDLLEIAANNFRILDSEHDIYATWHDELKLTKKEFITFLKLLRKVFVKESYESFKEILAPFIDDNWDV